MKKLFAALILTLAATAFAGVPWKQKSQGELTFYKAAGYGSCGTKINADTQMLVALSPEWFTNTSNPNKDPVCAGNVCIKIDYKGRSITVPVKDKCPGCQKNHLDLSRPAFEKLADPAEQRIHGATWQFVRC